MGSPAKLQNASKPGAMIAYQEMMYGARRDDPAVRDAWRGLLLQYCSLDTLSMVLIFEHWRRIVGLAGALYTPRLVPSATIRS